MAPERCVTSQSAVSSECIILTGRDTAGVVRCRVELERDDTAVLWWIRVLRHFLAWRYGACEIKLIG